MNYLSTSLKLFIIFILSGVTSVAIAQDEYQGFVRVVDGDTLEFTDPGIKIRLSGIDSMELAQTCQNDQGQSVLCGREGKAALQYLTASQQVLCRKETEDAYGRWIATCWTAQLEVNAEMVLTGHALAFRKYDTRYVPLEQSAQRSNLGIWAYQFTAPWDYRASKRAEAESRSQAPRDPDCNIKGNINRDDQKIYHLPGTRNYRATRIRQEHGERYFCTEEEAQRAGWRPAG